MTKTYAPVTTSEELTAALARTREAQEKFSTYTQEQVDAIFLAAATAANKARIKLAKLAVEEAGSGMTEEQRATLYAVLDLIAGNLQTICAEGLR